MNSTILTPFSAFGRRHIPDGAAVLFLAAISMAAHLSGLTLLLFPELGALAHCVITRPGHGWSRAPFMLAVTPALAGLCGTLAIHASGTGPLQILVVAALSLGLIAALRSPILPALSAGILPLVLGIRAWNYPLAIFLSCAALAVIAFLRSRRSAGAPANTDHAPFQLLPGGAADAPLLGLYFLFLATIAIAAQWFGRPLLLFPPLAVLAFETLIRAPAGMGMERALRLVALFFLCGAGGIIAIRLLGDATPGVVLAVTLALGFKAWLKLYVPPAIAVSILPFAAHRAAFAYPFEIASSVALLTVFAFAAPALRHPFRKIAKSDVQVANETRTPARRSSDN